MSARRSTFPRVRGTADRRRRRWRRFIWFKTGGPAEWLFEPKDVDDLRASSRELDPAVPVMAARRSAPT